MGGGSRHSKNAGTMGCEGMSYHERKALHFGTVKERLGKVRSRGASIGITGSLKIGNALRFMFAQVYQGCTFSGSRQTM